ncbi:MAG TPA: chromate efflux transporter [Nitrospirota bacterium]|nr:chromate efflux transporter [Nitrospirota bacterium]
MDEPRDNKVMIRVCSGSSEASLCSLFFTFFKIGLTAFGGFMALISVVQNYAVERKRMITHEDMLDGVSLASVLPGPVAVNVVAYVGYRARGAVGALVSAGAVILPAFLLVLALSYAYFTFGHMPAVNKAFQGFIPAVTAVIFVTAGNMATKAIKGVTESVIALSAAGLLLGVGGFLITVGIIVASGFAGWLLFHLPRGAASQGDARRPIGNAKAPDSGAATRLGAWAAPFPAVSVLVLPAVAKLLIVFGTMSVMLFGGGYVFIPLIQRIVVDGYGWVTRQEFIDAIAMGQVTPGPILISAAFIGYKVSGLSGAAAATLGIFTPPALVMLLCTRFMDRVKRSDMIKASLRGIRPAVIGMIAAAGVTVARTAPLNRITILIFCLSLVALLRWKVETVWVIPAAGAMGLLLY